VRLNRYKINPFDIIHSMKHIITIFALILMTSVTGCSFVLESGKKFLGTSTKNLEEARIDAQTKTYVCDFDLCFDSVLSLARDEEGLTPQTKKIFDTFKVKRQKGVIVVMGIEGNVDTTEVAIFVTTDGF
jgi:hypothetical protein